MSNGDPETPSDFGFELGLVARRWRRALDEALASSGLTDASWRPLIHLSRLGDGARQHDLARSLGIEGPTLVRMLDRLAEAGLVERREDPTDRRARTLRLTKAGRTAAERAESVVSRACENLVENVEQADMDACLRVFRAVLRNADGEAAR
jgi:MarR family transcriptional regulator for hemolysin